MSVRQHLFATLCACLAITLAATYALRLGQEREIAAYASAFATERQEQLDDLIADNSDELGLFAQDYSLWDDMVVFAASRDPEWARLNIGAVLGNFRLDAVWLISNSGEVLHTSAAPGAGVLTPPAGLERLAGVYAHAGPVGGFYKVDGRVVDFRALPVQPTADLARSTRPVAWLAAARVLDAKVIERMGRKLKARVELVSGAPDAGNPVEAAGGETGERIVRHVLAGWTPGEEVGEVRATFRLRSLDVGEYYNRWEARVLVGSGALLFVLVAWSLNRNVLRPLKLIGESLERHSPRPLEGVPEGLPEFARIAGLVRRAFRQQDALAHEIAERVRLGRDLHDRVIQNLYATGLGIAHGRRLIAQDPAAAEARLEETRRTLNETMERLRQFIARAEPEESSEAAFADGCADLFQTLRVDRECVLDLQVDAAVDTSLSTASKATLLFIVREAVSNALRHGRAKRVGVTLRPAGTGWGLRVEDDGAGYDPDAIASVGRGLGNMRARAAELGGALVVEAAPGKGTALGVTWIEGGPGRLAPG